MKNKDFRMLERKQANVVVLQFPTLLIDIFSIALDSYVLYS